MRKVFYIGIFIMLIVSCSSPTKLSVSSVSYQSLRNERWDILPEVPYDASIFVQHVISKDGELEVYVKNLTNEIMVIDRTMSFFVNTDGSSTSFYDPTIQMNTTTEVSSSTSGTSVNLGAVAGAVGVGGILGRALSGVNVGGASTEGLSVSNTVYDIDQPSVAIGPKGQIHMARVFQIEGVGTRFLSELASKNTSRQNLNISAESRSESIAKFSITITYSLDGGETTETITSDYFIDNLMTVYVNENGRTNEALRKIYSMKKDVFDESWYLIYFDTNIDAKNSYLNGKLYDYK